MEIRRTANAGVLLKLDGISILLDGVGQKVGSYLATPPEERSWLLENLPDALVFTHTHSDHYDPDFVAQYQRLTSGVILGPVTECDFDGREICVGTVKISPIPSRHLGKVDKTQLHYSYILYGSQCVWFLGDASPLQWQRADSLPKPDVVIAPYAYAATESAWERTKQLGAKCVVLVHLPDESNDPAELWKSVRNIAANAPDGFLRIPKIGETIVFDN